MKLSILVVICLLLSFSSIAQRKKKKTEPIVESKVETLAECTILSPAFFQITVNDRTSNVKNDPNLKSYWGKEIRLPISSLQQLQLKDHFTKWCKNATSTIDIEHVLVYSNGKPLLNYLNQNKAISMNEACLQDVLLGGFTKSPLTIGKNENDSNNLIYKQSQLYYRSSSNVSPEPIEFDEYGNPVYTPEDVDVFGNPISKEKIEYKEIDFKEIQALENWSIAKNGAFTKSIKGVSHLVEHRPSLDDFTYFSWSMPMFVNTSMAIGAVFKKNVSYSVPFNLSKNPELKIQYQNIVLALLENAKKGKYKLFVQNDENKVTLDLPEFNYKIEKDGTTPSSWDQIISKDGQGNKFLVHKYTYDSIPEGNYIDDGYGDPYYDAKDLDEFGQVKVYEGTTIEQIRFEDLAGIKFLEDWYLNPETGQLTKKVIGFSFIRYNQNLDAGEIDGITSDLGKTVFFKMK